MAVSKLPLPEIQHTLKYVLEQIRLFNGKEFDVDEVQKILDPVQKVLQERYVKMDNYIAKWWKEYAYMRNVDALAPQEVVVIPECTRKKNPTLIAAKFILGLVSYYSYMEIYDEPPNAPRGVCLNQFRQIFGTCRIPSWPMDTMSVNEHASHIVFVCENQFYRIAVLDEQRNSVSLQVVLDQLIACQNHAKHSTNAFSPGVFTTLPRNHWTNVRSALRKNAINFASMQQVESALFMVSMMPNEFGTNTTSLIHDAMSSQFAGNRWHDKTMQAIVYNDGQIACGMEHSALDGVFGAHPIHFAYHRMSSYSDCTSSGQHLSVHPLLWKNNLPDQLSMKMFKSIKPSVLDVALMDVPYIGRQNIKALKVSSDALVQVCLQLAYYRCMNTFVSTYESVGTVQFPLGRTETLRTLTPEIIAFINAFNKEEDSLLLLKNALQSHISQAKRAREGYGIDRHLLALQIVANKRKLPLPAFFTDDAFLASKTWKLSTSQVTYIGLKAFRPVAPDGFGVCYTISKNSISAVVTTYPGSAPATSNAFAMAIQDAVQQVFNLLQEADVAHARL